tara:strand:+ start:172 stop:591 length:420 start_codon:yes stop_codon:yes gene_type:complete
MRLIRRYPNRKLYDVQSSRYVSLNSLREMILSGEEIRVESSTDGKDLTRVTLARLKLVEAEQAVRSIPETVATHLGQGVEAMVRRLHNLESGIGQFRSTLTNPLARMEQVANQIDELQRSVDKLQERLEEMEVMMRDKE